MDAAVALLCVFVIWFPQVGEPRWRLVGQVLLICAVVGGVVLRWRRPVTAFGVVAAATVPGLIVGVTSDPFVARRGCCIPSPWSGVLARPGVTGPRGAPRLCA